MTGSKGATPAGPDVLVVKMSNVPPTVTLNATYCTDPAPEAVTVRSAKMKLAEAGTAHAAAAAASTAARIRDFMAGFPFGPS
jgi:hypothetical protein